MGRTAFGRRLALRAASAAALLLCACAYRPVADEVLRLPPSHPRTVCDLPLTAGGRDQGLGSAGARALLQADFGSNTPAGFRPGTQVGAQCPAGTRHCDEQDSCVDTLTDKLNCGRCANACDFNTEVCAGGRCVCRPGTTFCANLGKCFTSCAGFEPELNTAQAQPQGLAGGGLSSGGLAGGGLSGGGLSGGGLSGGAQVRPEAAAAGSNTGALVGG